MTEVTRAFIQGLPKAELHLHLEGSLEPELKLRLARKNHIDIGQSTIEEVKASYQFDSLTSFLAVYYPAMNVLQDESDFYALASDYIRRAAENGVKYAELFFDPQAHTSRGVPFDTVINGYYKAVCDAPEMGVEAHLIMCFLRDMSAESAMETYEQMLPHKDKIIGVGLDSDERNNPPEKFAQVFARAKADGLHITMHCDIDQIDSIGHIRTCLMDIGVERLDHGTNIVEDPALVQYVIDHKIGFTCCPCSNSFVTEAAASGGAGHRQLRRSRLFPELYLQRYVYSGGQIQPDKGGCGPAGKEFLRHHLDAGGKEGRLPGNGGPLRRRKLRSTGPCTGSAAKSCLVNRGPCQPVFFYQQTEAPQRGCLGLLRKMSD